MLKRKEKEENREEAKNSEQNGKVLSGVVSSVKMKDTAVVEINRYYKHPKYGKYVKSRKGYKTHDVGNTAKVGDKVKIIETKPISKDKKFRLLEIVSTTADAE